MGLGGLCDHASRGLSDEAAYRVPRTLLDQEMSAVTGACLLVRREVFNAVDGMDESYPSAFGDLDLCLRVREGGWAVVYAGSVALTHYEHQTYTPHYAGERSEHQEAETLRFRRRWADVVAVDPFHSPNLSLAAGAEGALRFRRALKTGAGSNEHLNSAQIRSRGCPPSIHEQTDMPNRRSRPAFF
jgi:GT2 family glycosyltransferase